MKIRCVSHSSLRLVGALIVALSIATAVPRHHAFATPSQAGGVPLRQVDWNSFLPTDPLVQSDPEPCIPPPPSARLGPCVSVSLAQPVLVNSLGGASGTDPTTGFTGYADTSGIIYADLDGDGLEEAVIRTESTGTGGSFGFLVYHQSTDGPQLVVAYPGYKLGVRLDRGLLAVSQPFYFGFEPNCCPTGSTTHWYLLGDNGLYDATDTGYILFDTGGQRAATPGEITVAGFYQALDARAYDVAYGLLSPEARALRSFEVFKAGYATTRSVTATVAPGATADEVRVTIASTDVDSSGVMTSRTFAGSWFMSTDPAAPLGVWLNRASITATTGQ